MEVNFVLKTGFNEFIKKKILKGGIKMKKIYLLSFLLTCFFMIDVAVASAEEANGDLTLEEGAEIYVPSEEDKKLLKEKLAEIEKIEANYLPDGEYYTLGVPVYQQINGYYCGPATVKQVTQYVKGSSNSQDYYAKQLGTTTAGTDMTRIKTFLQKNVWSSYVYSSIGTSGEWLSKIRYGMRVKKPAVLDIDTRKVSAFPYNSSGHFVNTSGLDTKYQPVRVRITDPYGPGLGNRWYRSTDLYNANKNHWRQAIIW